MDEFRALLRERLSGRGAIARLAEQSGVVGHLLSRYASDDPRKQVTPSPRNLKKLAPALGVPYEELLRMCGYLPQEEGAAVADPAGDDLEQELRRRTERFASALRGVPRVFWPTVLDASLALAAQMKTQPEPPVSPDEGPGVSGSQTVVIVVPPRRERRLPLYSLPSQRLLAVA